MTAELHEDRVLGAVRFVDAVTALPIDAPLAVAASGVRWVRNRRSHWVIAEVPEFESYESAFTVPPAVPAVGSVTLSFQVSDPGGRWLARAGSVTLPRDPDPVNSAQPQSLFAAIDVPLFPAPAAPTERGWAVVYGSVAGATPGTTLAGALVRVVRDSDGVRIGAGLSDDRGEVLIAIEGIPSTSLGVGDGPVVTTDVAVQLQVVWDPAAGPVPDPDALEASQDELFVRQTTASLAAGRVLTIAL